MRAEAKAELQMLRELAWFVFGCDPTRATIIIPRQCYFCGYSLLSVGPPPTFGHRRHSAPPLDITLHHIDENRENNVPENLALCHNTCHRSHHMKKRKATTKALEEAVTARVEEEKVL